MPPERDGRPERDDPLGRVRAEDRDPVARPNAVLVPQHHGGRRDEARVLGVREAAVVHRVAREPRVLGVALRSDFPSSSRNERARFFTTWTALAVDLFLDELEDPARAEQLRLDPAHLLGNVGRIRQRGHDAAPASVRAVDERGGERGDQVVDLAGAGLEHLELPTPGVVDVLPLLELHGVEPERGEAGATVARRRVRGRGRAAAAWPSGPPHRDGSAARTRRAPAPGRPPGRPSSTCSSRSWRLRCCGGVTSTPVSASRVRQLIGIPSTTWVPAVVMAISSTSASSTWAARIAPAITDRAALPVQRKTTCGGAAAVWSSVAMRRARYSGSLRSLVAGSYAPAVTARGRGARAEPAVPAPGRGAPLRRVAAHRRRPDPGDGPRPARRHDHVGDAPVRRLREVGRVVVRRDREARVRPRLRARAASRRGRSSRCCPGSCTRATGSGRRRRSSACW